MIANLASSGSGVAAQAGKSSSSKLCVLMVFASVGIVIIKVIIDNVVMMGLIFMTIISILTQIAKWYFGIKIIKLSIVGIYFYSLKPILVPIAYKDQVN